MKIFHSKKPPPFEGGNHRICQSGKLTPPIYHKETMMTLIDAGNCVRVSQERAGISNAEFARITNTSPQQIIRWRRNKNMKLHTMQLIANALGISLIVLISHDLPF